MTQAVGITAFGAYLPRLRLQRKTMAAANAWANPGIVAQGKGQRGAPNANALPTNLMMMKGLDVLGCPTVISTVVDPSIRPPRLAQILKWADEGKIVPHVSHGFPLADFKEAMRAKWRGDVIGGAVLHP